MSVPLRLSDMPFAPRLHTSVPGDGREGVTLEGRAEDNLRFIRDAMARAGSFTSVSGRGMMGAGVVGLAATIVSLPFPYGPRPVVWSGIWIAAAVLAGIESWLMIRRKAIRAGESLSTGPARRFTLAFAPALFAGAVLTVALAASGLYKLLPGTWLTLYGAAVTAGGAFSVREVPVMGVGFLLLGALCFASGPQWQPVCLGLGFGVLHLFFGYRIARYHGG